MPIPLGILAVAGAGAAGGASSFDLLETTLISGSSTTSVTFSSLNTYSEYKHLQIRAVVTVGQISVYFNGDKSEVDLNYGRHSLQGRGFDVISEASVGNERIVIQGLQTVNPCPLVADILDFSNTNKFTTWRSLQGNTRSGSERIVLQSGLWRKTDALTSIELEGNAAFASGSRFSLYGIK